MRDGLLIYDNVFTTEDCEKFIDYMDKLEERSLLYPDPKSNKLQIDHRANNLAHEYDVAAWSWVGERFFPKLQTCIDHYMSEYAILQRQKYLYYDVKLKKIPVGGGFHDWHCENSSITSATRTIVIQLYLNTIDEAGETEFLYLNKRVNAVQGRVIIFPAGFLHTHRGNPPIGQTKYIASTWGILQSKS